MELKALWTMFLRRWWIMLLPVVIVGALAVPDLLNPPSGGYTSTIRLTAAQPPVGELDSYEDGAQIPWTASEYLVNSLTAWVMTGSFAEEVSAELAANDVDIAAGSIYGAFAADNARSVMAVYIYWPDPDQLIAIAEAVVTVLQEGNQDYFPQLAAEPAQIIALDGIGIGAVPPSMMNRLRPLVKVGVALLSGIAVAVLVEYLDDSIRTRQDLEATLNVPVLGEIPRH